MSSDFRFPKSAVSLMAMILVAVFMVIDKAKSIQQSMPYTNPQIGPIHVAQVTVVPTMLLLLGIACAGGAAVWLVLFLLHRSGVHRLSDARPSSTPRGSSLSI